MLRDVARFIAGPQPVLRLISLLLAAIVFLLYLIEQDVSSLSDTTPCGDFGNPCAAIIERS